MSIAFNGNRLREARRFRQLSMPQLAGMLGISKQMVFKYEHNEAQPSTKVYQKIVMTLGFPIKFFQGRDNFAYSDMGTFYRSRLSATQSEKKPSELLKKYLAVLTNFFEEYVEFPELNKIDFSEDPKVAAIQLRKEWRLENLPINNMVSLLESHGFPMAFINSNSENVDAFGSQIRINDRNYYCILVDRDNNNFFRQQFSLAHELGHWVLHSGIINPQELDNDEYRDMEEQANRFAMEFLLPDEEFRKSIQNNDKNDLNLYLNLKDYWKVSVASMVYKVKNMNEISAEQYIRLQKRISSKGWRKVEPLDALTPIKKPVMMKQSYNLILNAGIFGNNSLGEMLEKTRGIDLPNEIIAELIGISVEKLTENENGKIVQMKREIL